MDGEIMPPRPNIRSADAVRDLRSGMTDAQLMEKYRLSAKGLESLLEKLVEIKAITREEIDRRGAGAVSPIDGADMIADIRSGMSDFELMEKYGLSSDGLRFALQTLVDTKVITVKELYGDTVSVEPAPETTRKYLAVALDIFDSERPEIRGEVTDISETGVGIIGIEGKVGERRAFSIPAEAFIGVDWIVFESRCRWAEKDKTSGQWSAGFEITGISEKCLGDLRRLIESLPFLD